MEAAYRRACAEGSKEVFLARMNLVGFHEAGKTSLAKRLMGKDFDANVKSTEGVALHYVTSAFVRNKLTGKQWNEADIKADELNKEVIEQMKHLGDAPAEQKSNDHEEKSMEPIAIKTTKKKINFFQKVSNFFSRKKKEHDVMTPDDSFETSSKGNVTKLHMSSRFKEQALATFDKISENESKENTPFTLRLWDLGGQNDFQSTHHLFLDVNATTVIVMDITKEFSEQFEHPDKDLKLKQSNPSSPEEIMHYWLSSLYEEAKKIELETNAAKHLNIFIVLTHIDDYHTEDEKEKRINLYKEQIKESLKDKKYKYLVTEEDIFAIDNKTGREETFQRLKEKLFESFSQQQSWNKTMPLKWLLLQADILEKKDGRTKVHDSKRVGRNRKKYWYGWYRHRIILENT